MRTVGAVGAADLVANSWAGCTPSELAAMWSVPSVYLYEKVGSTNDVARQLAVSGGIDRSVVIADQQVRGRGRAGRVWSSPPGLGLYLSQMLRPAEADLSTLPLRLGVLLADRLDRWADGATVTVKWPNDLLIGGRKLAGILCEAAWSGSAIDHVVVGVGINLLHREDDFPAEVRGQAISLAQLSPEPVSRYEVATAVIEALSALEGPSRWFDEIGRRNALADCLVEVADSETGHPVGRGRVSGFDREGGLVLADGLVQTIVRSGTVRVLPEP